MITIYFLEKKENPKSFFRLLLFIYIGMKFTQIFVFQTFIVDGPSMQPQFSNGNVLIVDRLSSSGIIDHEYQRGAVVVFNFKKRENFADGRFLLKRLIGLPGDTVIIENNNLKIIDEQGNIIIPKESLIKFNSKVTPNMVIKIPENQYFFMGDNRDESYDGRFFGTIHKKDLSGEVVFMIYPSIKFYPFKSFDYGL